MFKTIASIFIILLSTPVLAQGPGSDGPGQGDQDLGWGEHYCHYHAPAPGAEDCTAGNSRQSGCGNSYLNGREAYLSPEDEEGYQDGSITCPTFNFTIHVYGLAGQVEVSGGGVSCGAHSVTCASGGLMPPTPTEGCGFATTSGI